MAVRKGRSWNLDGPMEKYIQRGRSQFTGGGLLMYDGLNIKWTSRFIYISSSRELQYSPDGYIVIQPPPSGSIIQGAGTTGGVVVGSGGAIYLGGAGTDPSGWVTLYYEPPPFPGSSTGNTSPIGNYWLVDYNQIPLGFVVPERWIAVAARNPETHHVRWCTGEITWNTWHAVTPFTNGWGNYVDPTFHANPNGAGYTRVGGLVYMAGLVQPNGAPPGSIAFTLPANFRPLRPRILTIASSSGAMEIRIDNAGQVMPQNNPAWASLSGISFIAEA